MNPSPAGVIQGIDLGKQPKDYQPIKFPVTLALFGSKKLVLGAIDKTYQYKRQCHDPDDPGSPLIFLAFDYAYQIVEATKLGSDERVQLQMNITNHSLVISAVVEKAQLPPGINSVEELEAYHATPSAQKQKERDEK